jgi:hypothetical protein
MPPWGQREEEAMAVTPFEDLPLADRDRHWDADEVEKRVLQWAGAGDKPNEKYRKAFVWYDENNPDKSAAHQLTIADVIDGTPMAVPRAIIAAAAVLDGARGGVKVPEEDIEAAKSHLATYYAKMDQKPPRERG